MKILKDRLYSVISWTYYIQKILVMKNLQNKINEKPKLDLKKVIQKYV